MDMHAQDNPMRDHELEEEAATAPPRAERPRRPRICLMGEFSAGKSTLSNLLIGGRSLPVNVTATQLPPVWIAHGDDEAYRVDLDGIETPVILEELETVPVEDTSHICIFRQSELLELCDLIDMPGISDPNMSADVWQRVIHHADAVIWCTHATQAWRQSEAAVWDMMPPELHDQSFLLLTRMDKILNERDCDRVVRRVAKETKGLFRAQFPISLTKALAAGEDREKWEASGAEAFTQALVDLIHEISAGLEGEEPAPRVEAVRERPARPMSRNPMSGINAKAALPDEIPAPAHVMPSRIRPRANPSRPMRGADRTEGRNGDILDF